MGDFEKCTRFEPLKRFAQVQSGDQPVSLEVGSDEGFPMIGGGRVNGFYSKSNAPAGTVVIGRVGSSGTAYWANSPIFVTDNGFRVNSRRGVEPKWIYYALNTVDWSQVIAGSAQPLLTGQSLKNIRVPAPGSAREQNTILNFLDREISEIDALISNFSGLADLLDERLPSAVQQRIFRALSDDPSTKRARIPLGRFNAPPHPFGGKWTSLGYLAKIETGSMDTQDSEPEGEFPFFVRSDTVERTHSYTFNQEAILTAGDGAGVGKVFHHFRGKFAAHQRVYVITPQKVHGAFLYWVLRGYFGSIILGGTAKSTVESLRRPMLTGFPVPDLPKQRQVEIAQIMDAEQDYVEKQIANVHHALSLARERRAALITAAVTGQIDVTAKAKPAAEQLEDDIAQGLHREN